MTTIIVIPVYKRPEYLGMTLDSMLECPLSDAHILLSDDGSCDNDTDEICRLFSQLTRARYVTGKHTGVALNMLRALEQCGGYDAIITLDSDFIVKKDFIARLTGLLEDQGDADTIITGFNASSHPVLEQKEGYAVKKTIGGGNLCFTWEAYQKHIRPSLINYLWDWKMCDSVNRAKGRFLCLTPSAAQHIGFSSTFAGHTADTAEDF